MDDNIEMVKEFLAESYEYLDMLDQDLMALEHNPSDASILAKIFRALHTIKGTGGFLEFDNLVAIAHAGESLLDDLRNGHIEVNDDIVSSLLELTDAIRNVLKEIEQTGRDGEALYTELIKAIEALQGASGESADADLEQLPDAELEEDVLEYLHEGFELLADAEKLFEQERPSAEDLNHLKEDLNPFIISTNFLSYLKLVRVLAGFRKDLAHIEREPTAYEASRSRLRAIVAVIRKALNYIKKFGEETEEDYSNLIEAFLATSDVAPAAVKEPDPGTPEVAAIQPVVAEQQRIKKDPPTPGTMPENTIRVNVNLLDTLMNLVGELVLARNQILQLTSDETSVALTKSTHNLNLITTELQENVMKTRMQPLDTIFRKLPRVVRDLAKSCDKRVRVVLEGADTELDKTIIEAIKDPLTHIVRNAVDHGVELPDVRTDQGKPATGTLSIQAFHEGGKVIIEVSDDGAGIDPEKIKANALEKGMISPSQANSMSERDILSLVFAPGVSTAKEVSNISGRGVGMDVVRTHVERIGGTLDLTSKPGKGTTLKIKIPLTLAIIPALVVKVNEDRFVLPQVNLLELVRLEGSRSRRGIEYIKETPVYRLRGTLLPLVHLARELDITEKTILEDTTSDVIHIVVLQAEDQQFGLIVDEIIDTEEVVVKPLSKLIKDVPVLAGSTIMGDGKIALILDVVGLAKHGCVMQNQELIQIRQRASRNNLQQTDAHFLLLGRIQTDQRIAIPLSMIARLEEIEASIIETVDDQEVVQYRNQLMPLIRLEKALGLPASPVSEESGLLQIVVCQKNQLMVGVILSEIIDIVEEQVPIENAKGFVQSASIIQDKATKIINIQGILEEIDTSIYENGMQEVLVA